METADGKKKGMCFYAGIRASDGSGGHWQPGVPSHAWKRNFKESGTDREIAGHAPITKDQFHAFHDDVLKAIWM